MPDSAEEPDYCTHLLPNGETAWRVMPSFMYATRECIQCGARWVPELEDPPIALLRKKQIESIPYDE